MPRETGKAVRNRMKYISIYPMISGMISQMIFLFRYTTTKPITRKVKPIIEKIVNNFLYDLISFITAMVSLVGIMYKLFFHDDFMARTIVNIVFLVMIALTGLSRIIRATVIKKEKSSKEFVYAGMWVFIFLTHFLEFVCI